MTRPSHGAPGSLATIALQAAAQIHLSCGHPKSSFSPRTFGIGCFLSVGGKRTQMQNITAHVAFYFHCGCTTQTQYVNIKGNTSEAFGTETNTLWEKLAMDSFPMFPCILLHTYASFYRTVNVG